MVYLFILLVISAFIFQHPRFKGFIGEGRVRLLLKKFDSSENHIVFHDILLPSRDGKTTQIDHLILSIYGIIVIETKNYKGWIYGDEKKTYWTQVIYNRKEKLYNPIFQNFGHIKALEQIIGTQPFVSIIAFNPKATLKKIEINSERVHVTYDSRLLKVIRQYQEQVILHDDLEKFKNLILNNIVKEKGAQKEHIRAIRHERKQKELKIKANICPKCGGALVTRKGKYGFFQGCSNFPSCRFIENKKHV